MIPRLQRKRATTLWLVVVVACSCLLTSGCSAFGILSFFKSKKNVIPFTGFDLCLQDACAVPSSTKGSLLLLECLTDEKRHHPDGTPSLELLLTTGLSGLCATEVHRVAAAEARRTVRGLEADYVSLKRLKSALAKTKKKLVRSRERMGELQGALRKALHSLTFSHEKTALTAKDVGRQILETFDTIPVQDEAAAPQQMVTDTRKVLQQAKSVNYVLRQNSELADIDGEISVSLVHACLFVASTSLLSTCMKRQPLFRYISSVVVVCDIFMSFGDFLPTTSLRSQVLALIRLLGMLSFALNVVSCQIHLPSFNLRKRKNVAVEDNSSRLAAAN